MRTRRLFGGLSFGACTLLAVLVSSALINSCRKAADTDQVFPNVKDIQLQQVEVDPQAMAFAQLLADTICQEDGGSSFLAKYGDKGFHRIEELGPDAPYFPSVIEDINTGKQLEYEAASEDSKMPSSVTMYSYRPDFRVVLTPAWCANTSGVPVEAIIEAMKELVRRNDGKAKVRTSEEGQSKTLTSLYRVEISTVELLFMEKQHLENSEVVDSRIPSFLFKYSPTLDAEAIQ